LFIPTYKWWCVYCKCSEKLSSNLAFGEVFFFLIQSKTKFYEINKQNLTRSVVSFSNITSSALGELEDMIVSGEIRASAIDLILPEIVDDGKLTPKEVSPPKFK